MDHDFTHLYLGLLANGMSRDQIKKIMMQPIPTSTLVEEAQQSCSKEILHQIVLGYFDNVEIMMRLARNLHTSTEDKLLLSNHKAECVRCLVDSV